MLKRVLMSFLVLLLVVQPLQANAGSFGKGDPTTTPGEWYVGQTPSHIDPNKAPIVFVHGLNSSTSTWTDENDMDEVAYQNGYQTAYINLYPDKNMWDNGALFANKLREIYEYFGNKKLVVVAHSKGGIDTQAALVHYEAYPFVARVVTLGTPHKGSQLANLAYSSWASWLAGIIGSKNDATYSLQTGYMQNFRQQTDSHVNVGKVPFYTLAGTEWGSFGSSLYFGGLYLSQYGTNDGAVTVDNSRLNYATEVRVGRWNHSTIKEGSSTFSHILPYLSASTVQSASSSYANEYTEEMESVQSYFRGGQYQGEVKETFYVEDGAENIYVNWLSENKNTNITLIDPNGNIYKNFQTTMDNESVFKGAYVHSLEVKQPVSGQWTVLAKNKQEYYFLNVTFVSPINEDVTLETIESDTIQLSFTGKNKHIKTDELMAAVSVEYMDMKNRNVKKLKFSKKIESQRMTIQSLGDGIYNITIDLEGKTLNGKAFNRTIVESVYLSKN